MDLIVVNNWCKLYIKYSRFTKTWPINRTRWLHPNRMHIGVFDLDSFTLSVAESRGWPRLVKLHCSQEMHPIWAADLVASGGPWPYESEVRILAKQIFAISFVCIQVQLLDCGLEIWKLIIIIWDDLIIVFLIKMKNHPKLGFFVGDRLMLQFYVGK